MKTLKIFSCLFLAASLFASCSSESDLIEEPQKPEVPEIDYSKLTFTEFGIDIKTVTGEVGTRSSADVDIMGRPLGRYPLTEIYLVSTNESGKDMLMDLKKSTKAEYAFVDASGRAGKQDPTHVIIRPKDTPKGVLVKLSTMEPKSGSEDGYQPVDGKRGDSFYYMSQKNNSTITLPSADGQSYQEFGDKLFKSKEYLLTYDKSTNDLIAYEYDDVYKVAYRAKGTEVGGLWPIYVNRVSAAMSLRYMVSGEYYNANKDISKGEERNAAIESAFKKEMGFSMSAMYTDEAYISMFPISCTFDNTLTIDYSKNGNLIFYNNEERVEKMTEIVYEYASAHQERGAMGLAATAVPFIFPTSFTESNYIHLFVGVKANNKNVRMHFKIRMSREYAITSNTNTYFYLTMTTKELKAFYDKALNTPSTRSGEVVFELPSSHLAVSTTPEMAN